MYIFIYSNKVLLRQVSDWIEKVSIYKHLSKNEKKIDITPTMKRTLKLQDAVKSKKNYTRRVLYSQIYGTVKPRN